MRSCTLAVSLVLAAAAAAGVLRAQPPDVEAVVDKARDYVAAYEHDFVGVVAEELYRQDARGGATTSPRRFPVGVRSQRGNLKFDVRLVRAPARDPWQECFPGFGVDGKPVPNP